MLLQSESVARFPEFCTVIRQGDFNRVLWHSRVSRQPVDNDMIHGRFEGDTALMLAVRLNNLDITEVILNHAADAALKDDFGNTAFHYACHKRDARHRILDRLLSSCPDSLMCLEEKNVFGNTVLMEAVYEKSRECVRLLLRAGARFDPSWRYTTPFTWEGMTVVEAARVHRHRKMIDVLIDPGVLMFCL